MKSAWAGLAAGCLHTLAGADHLAALTPLTIGRSQIKASLLGALWGFGHSTGQLILGLLMVLLKDKFQQVRELGGGGSACVCSWGGWAVERVAEAPTFAGCAGRGGGERACCIHTC